MNVLGLSFGRKLSNCDIMVKAALKECEKAGHEIKFIEVDKLNIQDCTGCISCVIGMVSGRGKGGCHLKDDFHIIDEALMECDAVIIASPTFEMLPTGTFKTVCDRIGPSHDITFRQSTYDEGLAAGKSEDQLPDKRSFKPRVGALIAVGGAMTENWLSFMIPTMYAMTMSMNIQVVDTYKYFGAMAYPHVLGNETAMERSRTVGRNIVDALASEGDDRNRWRGDHEGVCPVCHCDMLTVSEDRESIECPVCGIYGKFAVVDGKLQTIFSEEEQARSRLYIPGKIEHSTEIKTRAGEAGPVENLQEMLKEYKW